jgi:hypothetical protein
MGENGQAAAAHWDETLRTAVGMAAAKIAPTTDERKLGERRHLVPALGDALGELLGTAHVSAGMNLATPLPDWRPLPGPLDLLIGEPPVPSARPVAGIEVKSRAHRRKLGETPYDIFKLASFRRLEGVEAAYLVVAGTTAGFSGNEPGAALFKTPVGTSEEWYSSYLVDEWRNGWRRLLGDGNGKPVRVPWTMRLQLVCIQDVPAFGDWEIRVLRVDNPRPGRSLRLGLDGSSIDVDVDPFENGPPQIRDSDLRPAHVPRPDCAESDLHLFALSCNGYAREGNLTNCARLADEARARWDEMTEVPHDLRTLRSCLFFEQRRAQKSGNGFWDGPAGTLDYVHALVEAVRAHVSDRSN